jgi:DNA-binding transcriptional LysR family regulator
MPNWTLKQLESFVWVAKLGSFRATAERLHTTQPNISVRIAQLEAAIGSRLLHRGSGSVTLTGSGQALLGYAERVLLAADEFTQRTGGSDQETGLMRLGVAELIAQTWLHEYLRRLRQLFPRVDVELKIDLTVNLREELVARTLDLGLLNGPISNFAITNIELGSVPYVWVASPQLAIEGTGIAALARHAILTHARNTRHHVEVAAYFRENCKGAMRIVPSSSLAACLRMAVDGLGIAPVPRTVAEAALAAGGLVTVDHDWLPTPLAFTASFAHTPANFLLGRAAELARDCADELG